MCRLIGNWKDLCVFEVEIRLESLKLAAYIYVMFSCIYILSSLEEVPVLLSTYMLDDESSAALEVSVSKV